MTEVDMIAAWPVPENGMKWGGVYLEEEIAGYRTLSVNRDDNIDVEITTINNPIRNGDIYLRKRNTPRTIAVEWGIKATTATNLQNNLNKLRGILSGEQQQVIFADEPNRYFVGTVQNFKAESAGKYVSTGTFEIYCVDPYKYSVSETEVQPTNGVYEIDYAGTQPSFPTLEAVTASELAYISYTNQDNKILQFGTPPSDEEGDVERSEIRFDQTFSGSVPSTWTRNNGVVSEDLSEAKGHVRNGTAKIITQGVTANSWGSVTSTCATHGVSLTRQIPNSSGGTVGAKNWTLEWEHLFYSNNLKSWGEVAFVVAGTKAGSSTKEAIAEIHIVKSTIGSNACRLYFYVANARVKGEANAFTCEADNLITGTRGGKSSITKLGSKYVFNIGTKTYSFLDDTDYTATEVTVGFNAWKSEAVMTMNAVKSIKFTSHGAEITSTDEIPNPFASGDELIVDTKDGSVQLNGAIRHGLGALGNDWEDFCLKPGANEIQCLYDSGATAPAFKLRYREVYL